MLWPFLQLIFYMVYNHKLQRERRALGKRVSSRNFQSNSVYEIAAGVDVMNKLLSSEGAAIAQWICLRPPSCGPGFES